MEFKWGRYVPENPEGYQSLETAMKMELEARKADFEALASLAAEKAKPVEVPAEIEAMLESNERWLADHPDSHQYQRFLYVTDTQAWKDRRDQKRGSFRRS